MGLAQANPRWRAALTAMLWAAAWMPSAQAVADDADEAATILQQTGVRGGLVVHVGCGDGRLTAALRAGDAYLVHGLDADAANVAAARTHVRKLGLADSVWIDQFDGARLPYAENMVNLLVAQDLGAVPMQEVMRVLAPNGVAYVKQEGAWVETVKPWPADIDEWTHWLHGPDGNAVARDERAGPPRRFRWVAAPLWSRSHDSVPSVSAIVSAKGRLFTIVDEAPVSMDGSAPDKWSLVARDAFNGIELWRIAIPEWGWRTWARRFTCRFTVPTHMPRRLVAVGDRVYATLGFNAPLTELDAATGKVLRTFPGTQFTDEILCAEGLLVIAINQAAQEPGPKRGESPPPVPKWVAAIDRRSGTIRWKTGDYVGLRSKTGPMERITHLSMAAGGGRVFFVNGEKIISLNLKDGTQAWRVPRPEVPEHKMRYDIRITDMCSLLYSDGIVLFAQLNPDRKIDWREIRGRVHAFSADTGKEIWNRQCASWGWAHPADVFVLRGLVWVTDFKNDFVLGLDPKTGEVRQKVSDHKAFDNAHHHRCYRNKATVRYMMTSFRGLEFIDWDSGRTDLHHWVRGTCRLGAIPCNGMVYATPHPCDCYITSKLNGLLALEPAAAPGQAGQGGREGPVLVKGPAFGACCTNRAAAFPGRREPSASSVVAWEGHHAETRSPSCNSLFGQIGNRKPEIGSRVSEISNRTSEIPDGDWPTYRHDARRSGAAAGAVAMPLKTAWQRDLGGALTAPVVADGRLFVARKAGRDVVCLDAASGGEQWRYTAGGKLDTPPTVDGGRVVFGSADGWVTCLRATDGLLMWRFRAAPRERLVAAFGGLESAWPVHGSVLVQDGTVYCTAGRSSFLDGGIYAFALRLDSGEVLARERLRSDHAMQVDWGRDQTVDNGVLSDLLVAHEGGIYLRQRPLFGKGRSTRFPTYLRASGGLLDTNWFHRTRWFLRAVPMAEYLVFNDERVCGVRARKRIGGYGGHFAPGAKGYELFAADKRAVTPPKPEPARLAARPKTTRGSTGRPAGASSTPKVRTPKDRWCIRVPVRVTAMLLAGNLLVAAGTPDVICAEDPWAAYEGRKGGRLLVVSADDGTVQGDMRLAAPPVLDGLAAARGRLYLATIDGCVLCLGQTK